MSLYTTTRRILGSILTPIRTLCNARQVRMFKGVKNIKCNAFVRTKRQPVIRFRKGNYRQISQSSTPLESFCLHPKPFPSMKHEMVDEFRLNSGYIVPIARYSGFPGMARKPIGPMAGHWRWYAQSKEPSSPAPGKGGPVTSSGGGLGKLDAANESGFFHKVNKSRLDQIKQMLKEKAMLRGTDNHGKKDST